MKDGGVRAGLTRFRVAGFMGVDMFGRVRGKLLRGAEASDGKKRL